MATVLIVSFSLLAYVTLHNWRSSNARAVCMVLLSVMIVYGGDVLLVRAERPGTIQFLLRAQWLGIALVPASYVHLAAALRAINRPHTHAKEPLLRWLVLLAYVVSIGLFALALFTDVIVRGGISRVILTQFEAGPFFWLYVVYVIGSMLLMLRTIERTHHHALTPTLRRRMRYLRATFFAPGLGVFPYLVVFGDTLPVSDMVMLSVAAGMHVLVVGLLTVMTYSVGFQGVPHPDRLIKQDFLRWFLYGPTVGVTIILCIQIVPWLDTLLGLPSDTLITFVVMMMTVLMPMFISRVRPYLDALIYRQDQEEMDYLRKLPRSIFTGADLRQLLENTLIAVCGSLNVETGFVAGHGKDGFTVKALCGSRRTIKRFLEEHPLDEVITQLERVLVSHINHNGNTLVNMVETFISVDDFRLLPLHSPDGLFLGTLAVANTPDSVLAAGTMMPESQHLIDVLTHHMELALATFQLQHQIVDNLRELDPEMQSLQQLNTQLEQATPASLATLDTDVSLHPQFAQLVKDALTHYWGGPKLSDSPLLTLRSVRRLTHEPDVGGSTTKALQVVLRQAINNLRPEEQLDSSAQEWLLYNILELRFLQGKRTRDVANRLAMSESDYYRKQRIAVEEVARQLTIMEDSEKTRMQ